MEILVSGVCVVLELAQSIQGPDIGGRIEDLARSAIFLPVLGKGAVSEPMTNGINSVDNLLSLISSTFTPTSWAIATASSARFTDILAMSYSLRISCFLRISWSTGILQDKALRRRPHELRSPRGPIFFVSPAGYDL
jgi:hypothetical protein